LFAAAGMTPERLIALNSEVHAFRDAVTNYTGKTGATVAETAD
jgi:hypothetical protein